jgi:hypothetical protein
MMDLELRGYRKDALTKPTDSSWNRETGLAPTQQFEADGGAGREKAPG